MLDAARALPILVLDVAVMFGASAPSVAARDVRPAAQPTPGLAVETLFEAAFPEDAIPERGRLARTSLTHICTRGWQHLEMRDLLV